MNVKASYPTYADMSEWGDNQKGSNFLCVPHNDGATTYDVVPTNEHSFGIARYFFRLSMTSAIETVPFAYVNWCLYRSMKCTQTYFEGTMTEHEWTTGPSMKDNISPFVVLDHVVPSRFVLAYDAVNDDDTLDIAFLALDGKRVGEKLMTEGSQTLQTTKYYNSMFRLCEPF